MIISPPFLPDRTGQSEEAWLDVAMTQPASRLASTNAPEGSFPLSLKLGWHNGLRIQAPRSGGAYLPVRAIADGKVVFVQAPTALNVNGGTTHLENRVEYFGYVWSLLNDAPVPADSKALERQKEST